MEIEIYNSLLLKESKLNFYESIKINNKSVGVYLLLTNNKKVVWVGISRNNFYDDVQNRLKVIGENNVCYIAFVEAPKNRINKLAKRIVDQIIKNLSRVQFIEIPYVNKNINLN